MMAFMLKRVFHKLWDRKRIYMVVAGQFCIGILILNMFLNLSIGIEDQLGDLLLENRDQEFYITARYQDQNFYDAASFDLISWGQQEAVEGEYPVVPFESGLVGELREAFPEMNLELETTVSIDILINGHMDTRQICYSSRYEKVRASRAFIEGMNSEEIYLLFPRLFPFQLTEQKLYTMGRQEYDIDLADMDEDVIYIPYAAYEDLYHPNDLLNTRLKLHFQKNPIKAAEDTRRVIERLSDSNSTFSYHVNNDYYDMLRKVNTAYEQATAFNFIAVILFIIIVVGLSGLFVLIMNTRKKEIAICLALGADKKQMYLESFLEVLAISLTGCLTGIGICTFLLCLGVEFATVKITPHFKVSIILILLSCFVSIISTIPACASIKKLTPMEILRTE